MGQDIAIFAEFLFFSGFLLSVFDDLGFFGRFFLFGGAIFLAFFPYFCSIFVLDGGILPFPPCLSFYMGFLVDYGCLGGGGFLALFSFRPFSLSSSCSSFLRFHFLWGIISLPGVMDHFWFVGGLGFLQWANVV